MAGYGNGSPPPATTGGSLGVGRGKEMRKSIDGLGTPTLVLDKTVAYSASANTMLLNVSEATDATSTLASGIKAVRVRNTGIVPTITSFAYQLWTTSTAQTDASEYQVQYMLLPGETITLPSTRGIITDAGVDNLAVGASTKDSVLPSALNSGNLYINSGALLAEPQAADEPDIDIDDGSGGTAAGLFRVGDTIRIEDEIMEITKITGEVLTVVKGLYGSSSTSHNNNDAISFPFFNHYEAFGRYTLAQTTASGRFTCPNLFGLGRAVTDLDGIVPGSFAAIFYNPGSQRMTNDGNITSSTNSGLVAGRTYYMSISIDGGTTDKVTFTVDSSNTRFGQANGIISKLQSMIDALYYDESVNNYEKGATVSIINGDVTVTSNQRTNASAISITTNTDGTGAAHTSSGNELFDTSNIMGRFPATIPVATPSRLPRETSPDPITGEASYNNVFMMDDGHGRLFGGIGQGTIDYNSGAIDFTGPSSAEFAISALYTSAFAGSVSATSTTSQNTLSAVFANTPCQKSKANVKLEIFS